MPVSNEQAEALYSHLAEGTTTTCRCWLVERSDGWKRGFTDHDEDVSFDGMTFVASSGFTASALETTTGLAVNNSEVVGALSDAGISSEDIEAGRFDNSAVTFWLVNWENPAHRDVRFRGSIGEVCRNDEAFSAELRGMSDPLNLPRGRVYQSDCSAVLGDSKCRVDTSQAEFSIEVNVLDEADARVFQFFGLEGYEPGWFERGRLEVVDGKGAGLIGWVKNDLSQSGNREITLWLGLRAEVNAGDRVRLVAGCDKRAATCSRKFFNFNNFRGCPHIPGEDWLTAYPRSGKSNNGRSMNAPIVS